MSSLTTSKITLSRSRITSGGAATETDAPKASPNSPATLSKGVKVGLGVGIPVGVLALSLLLFFFLRRRERTRVAVERTEEVAQGVKAPIEMDASETFDLSGDAISPVDFKR